MAHIKRINEMFDLEENILGFLKKNLKENMNLSELRFCVCTKMNWKPAGEGYSYVDKMMRYSFSKSGSDIEYPQLETYFECEKTGEDKDGSYVCAKNLKNAILWNSKSSKLDIL